ncbi:hypothetical protein FPSE_11442 [Fusarium pseudograminearum CS3096]|uniref:Uncharacterized protein n=1 Tax=Fusarium pseudograminearum (strain CS3096) TaxID=1028729 RepID=K3V607_FUSPC|nr:hypothetical protein FPSE_11442 [Fusarium pseudograminearum CS3096]EKJ68434.1 hypothetical protein FPSE_11442 [Fusarium pseudograminearum CS3096]
MSSLSATYKTSNVSETTLVDTSKLSTSTKPGLETTYKPSLKEKIQRKLSGSVDPTKKPADPYKSWEARSVLSLVAEGLIDVVQCQPLVQPVDHTDCLELGSVALSDIALVSITWPRF